jgi:hypothetical protein
VFVAGAGESAWFFRAIPSAAFIVIRTSTALFPAAESHQTGAVGSRAGDDFCFR